MTWVIRLLVAGFAALFMIIGVRASLDPQTIITQFELGMQNATGISAIRADMGAFFMGTGLAALVGLFPGRRQWLLGAATMVALAFAGRAIGLMNEPLTANIAQSMIIEAVSIALLVAAFGILSPRRRQMLAQQQEAEREAQLEQQRIATEQGHIDTGIDTGAHIGTGAQNEAHNVGRAQRDSDLAQPIG